MRKILIFILLLLISYEGMAVIIFPKREKISIFTFLNFSYKQSNILEQRAGYGRLSVGISGRNDTKRLSKDVYEDHFELLDFGITGKFHNNLRKPNYYFDFTIIERCLIGRFKDISKFFPQDVDLILLKKDTKLYSVDDYEWLSLLFGYGLDLSSPEDDFYLLPSLYLQAGLRTFYPDTLNIQGLNEDGKKLKWDFLNSGIKLKTIYKNFSFDYILNYNVLSSAAYLSNTLQLKYSFTKEEISYLSMYLNYRNELIGISQEENTIKNTINKRIESLNFGISFQPFLHFGKSYEVKIF